MWWSLLGVVSRIVPILLLININNLHNENKNEKGLMTERVEDSSVVIPLFK